MQLEFVEGHPSVDFIFGRMANVFQDSGLEKDDFINADAREYLVENAGNLERLFEHLIVQNFIGTPTVMARRESLARVGIFDEKMKIGEDLDYWLRAAVLCKWGFIDEVLIKRRRHTGNLISDWLRWNTATIHVLEETAAPLSISRPGASELLARRLGNLRIMTLAPRILSRGKWEVLMPSWVRSGVDVSNLNCMQSLWLRGL